MSRSFIVHSPDKKITLTALLQTMQSLPDFPLDLREAEIHEDNGFFCFSMPETGKQQVFLHYLDTGCYYIESRALDKYTASRKLFLAVACAVSVLTDAPVSSGDGAWVNADSYVGTELWTAFLHT